MGGVGDGFILGGWTQLFNAVLLNIDFSDMADFYSTPFWGWGVNWDFPTFNT